MSDERGQASGFDAPPQLRLPGGLGGLVGRLNGHSGPPADGDADEQGPSALSLLIARFWLLGVLLALIVAFTVAAPDSFLTTLNLKTILVDASVVLILAVGQTFVIATAGIDLSVGSVLVFSGIVAAKYMEAHGAEGAGWPVVAIGIAIAMSCGTAWGVLNGLLIARLRLPPLIVTLGTLGGALGLAQVLTSGLDITSVPSHLSDSLGFGEIAGVPAPALLALAVLVLGGVMLNATRFGRWTLAVGSDAEASRRAGINVSRQLLKVYAFQGLLAGTAGILSLARFSSTTISGHGSDNLTVIASVVLGGTSLFGGVATVFGTLIGVLIPAVLLNGLVIVGLEPFWQSVVIGAVLVIAVYVDQLRRRLQQRA
jgi:ribose transport system permease protein